MKKFSRNTLFGFLIAWTAGIASASPFNPEIFLAGNDQPSNPRYGYGVVVGCADCHVGLTNSGNFNPGFPTALRAFFNGGTLVPATSFDDALTGIHAVEPDFAPFIPVADRLLTVSGDAVFSDVPFDPGYNFDQDPSGAANSSLARVTASWTTTNQGNVAIRPGQDKARITFDGASAKLIERGNRRRTTTGICNSANPDFSLLMTPVNDFGFRPTSSLMVTRNTVSICFTNILPTGGASTKSLNVFENTSNVARLDGGFVTNIITDINPDSDADTDPTDATAALSATLVTSPLHAASFALNSNGNFTYEASAASVSTTDSFVYKVTDSEGGESAAITVEINIVTSVAGNNAPVAVDDVATVNEDSALQAVNVLSNDTDEDPTGLLITGLGTITGPGSASISADRKTVLVTPDANSNAPFTVVYQISDIFGVPATGELVVSVLGSPDYPTADIIVVTPDRDDSEPAFSVDLLDPVFVVDPDPLDVLFVVQPVITVKLVNKADLPVPPGFNLDFPVTGGQIAIDPTRFDFVNIGEQADLRFDYTVDDGTGRRVTNSVYVIIIGTPNGTLRIPGVLADSMSSRYNGNFPNSRQTPEACLSCHLPNMAGSLVDDNCTATVNGVPGTVIFNSFGLSLCEARNPLDPPLTDLLARLEAQEDTYAPLLGGMIDLVIAEDEPVGTVLAQAAAVYNGLTLDGGATSIVTYILNDDGDLGNTAFAGAFGIDDLGELTVAGRLTPGEFPMDIRPVNDAKQMDASFTIIGGRPGFFPVRADLILPKIFMITVTAVPVITVPDTATTESSVPVEIDVTANDTGGQVSRVALDGGQPANGVVTINVLTNTFTYTPNGGFGGVDTFDYVAFNTDDLSSNVATVTVNVVNAGGLVANDDTKSVVPGISSVIDVLANDLNVIGTGVDATVVTLLAGSLPDTATVGTFSVTGQDITFTPAVGFTAGMTTIQYQGSNPAVSGVNASIASLTVEVIEFDGSTGAGASAVPELANMASAFLESCGYAVGSGGSGTDFSNFLSVCVDIQSAINGGENIDQALRALRNEEHFAAVDSTALIARSLGNILQGRIEAILRGGTRGVDLSGVSLTIDGVSIPSRALQDLGAYLLGAPPDDANDTFSGTTPWGMFVAGEFAFGKKDSTDTTEGMDFSANNIIVGIDYRRSENLVFGFAGGYSSTETLFGDGGSLTGQGLQLSAFASVDNFRRPGLQLDAYLSAGIVSFQSDRAIAFTANGVTVDEVATASFTSTYINFVPRVSFATIFGEYGDPIGDLNTDLQLTVYGSLDYLLTYISGYQETGGGGLNLDVQGQFYQSLIASAGLTFDRPIYLPSNTIVMLSGGVSLNGEFLDNIRSVTSSFVAAGLGSPEFTITGPGTAGLYFAADIGASIDIGRGNLTFGYAIEQQVNDPNLIQRISVNYATRVGKSGVLGIGANQTQSVSRNAWAAELSYSQDF